MNRGDGLASGAKSASFTAADKRMTKEQWAAMFEPDPEVERIAEEQRKDLEKLSDELMQPIKETQRI